MKKKKQSGGFLKGLFIFAFGATSGLGAAAFVAAYVNDLPMPFIESPTRTPTNPLRTESEDEGREEVQFHELLRQQTPAVSVPAAPAVPDEPPAPAPASAFVYHLQIGAYTNQDAAQQLRGQLILNGWTPVIKQGKTADGSSIYRVWIGPYDSEEDAENDRAQLALAGYAQTALFKISAQ